MCLSTLFWSCRWCLVIFVLFDGQVVTNDNILFTIRSQVSDVYQVKIIGNAPLIFSHAHMANFVQRGWLSLFILLALLPCKGLSSNKVFCWRYSLVQITFFIDVKSTKLLIPSTILVTVLILLLIDLFYQGKV